MQPAVWAVPPRSWGEADSRSSWLGVCPTGSSLDMPGGVGPGGQSAASCAVMVAGRGGPSRGGKSEKSLHRDALT